MTDKVQKIREKVEKLKSQLLRGACSSQVAMETRCKEEAYNDVLGILDFMQEEPLSNKTEKAIDELSSSIAEELRKQLKDNLKEEPVSEDIWEASKQYALRQVLASTDTKMSEQAYLSLKLFSGFEIAVAHKDGANWQKEQFEKNRLKHCDSITNEQAELEQDFIDQHLDKYQRMPTFLDAIEYGIDYGKHQMIKDAVESEVNYYEINGKGALWFITDYIDELKNTDKIKLIILNED